MRTHVISEEVAWKPSRDVLPPTGEQVFYRTDLYRCAGYLDGKGNWRDSHHRIETRQVLAWTMIRDAFRV
jgi:hypothetical protein